MEKIAPLFKGATRPACILGVPLKPFIGCIWIFSMFALWLGMPLLLGAVPCIYVMRQIAKDDDQRFRQIYLYLFVNVFGTGNKRHWQSVQSFSPAKYPNRLIKRKNNL